MVPHSTDAGHGGKVARRREVRERGRRGATDNSSGLEGRLARRRPLVQAFRVEVVMTPVHPAVSKEKSSVM
jgi:hypothetical protein